VAPPAAIADALLWLPAQLGFAEVRLNLRVPATTPRPDAIGWMQEVVELVYAG
jgi:hypothetical protein